MKWTKRKYENNIHSVGIAGTYDGVGVTHVSLAVANYLASVQSQKTLYIELGEKEDLLDMLGNDRQIYNGEIIYVFRNVSYVLNANAREAVDLLKKWQGAVVLDIDRNNLELLAYCQRRIVLSDNCPWRRKQREKFMKIYQESGDIFPVHIFENDRIEKENSTDGIGIIENPCMLKREDFLTIEKLLYK